MISLWLGHRKDVAVPNLGKLEEQEQLSAPPRAAFILSKTRQYLEFYSRDCACQNLDRSPIFQCHHPRKCLLFEHLNPASASKTRRRRSTSTEQQRASSDPLGSYSTHSSMLFFVSPNKTNPQ